jgi:hypothetical protein
LKPNFGRLLFGQLVEGILFIYFYLFCARKPDFPQAFQQHKTCKILTSYEMVVNFHSEIAGIVFSFNFLANLCG